MGQPHSFISGAEGRGGELDRRWLSRKRKLMNTEFLQVDRIFVETRRILLNQNRKGKIPFIAPTGSGPKRVPGKGTFLDFIFLGFTTQLPPSRAYSPGNGLSTDSTGWSPALELQSEDLRLHLFLWPRLHLTAVP